MMPRIKLSQFILSIFSILLCVLSEVRDTSSNPDFPFDRDVFALQEFLFPNQTAAILASRSSSLRRLQVVKKPYTGPVECTVCQGLTSCSALNGYYIEEVYYPNNLNYLETCKVIDSLAKRLTPLIFGEGRTFRDTPQCRTIVLQYLCLFYGSNNPMYTNYCVFQEDVSDPNPANHKVAPRPPCRSFCVQTATVCANEPDYFIQTCQRIACPPTEDQCTPDPVLDGQTLAANLGCTVPYYNNPYFSSAFRSTTLLSAGAILLIAVVTFCFALI